MLSTWLPSAGRWLLASLMLFLALSGISADTEPNRAVSRLGNVIPVLDEFNATVTRTPAPNNQLPFVVSRIEGQALSSSAAGLADDVLRQIPGFSLFRRTSSLAANPTTQGFTLRGIGPSGTSRSLLLFDGSPLNDAFGGWVQWGKIDLARIQSIDVLRGGGGTAWGNAALGGVIHITPAAIEESGGQISISRGELGLQRLSSRFAAKKGPLAAALDFGTFRTNGYLRIHPSQRGAVDQATDFRNHAASLTFEFTPRKQAAFRARISHYHEQRSNGTPLTANRTHSWRWQHTANFVTPTDTRILWTAFLENTRYASTFSSVNSDRSSERLVLDQFRVPSLSLGSSLTVHRSWGAGHQLTVGGDFRWIDGETRERVIFTGTTRVAGGRQVTSGLFIEQIFNLDPVTALTIGVRGDYWEDRGGFLNLTPPASPTQSTRYPDSIEWQLTPRLGLHRKLGRGQALRLGAYRAFRAPTINERYRPFQVGSDRTRANPALQSEVLHGFETTWAWDRPGHAWITATLFWNEISGAVANVTLNPNPIGGVDRQRQNLDRVLVRGVELSAETRIHPQWLLTARYAMSDARVRRATQQVNLQGNRLAQVPEHQGNLSLNFEAPNLRWSGRVAVRFQSSQYEDDANARSLEAFAVLDAALRFQVTPEFSISLTADNLLNHRYADGKPGDTLVTIAPPRLVVAALDFEF